MLIDIGDHECCQQCNHDDCTICLHIKSIGQTACLYGVPYAYVLVMQSFSSLSEGT